VKHVRLFRAFDRHAPTSRVSLEWITCQSIGETLKPSTALRGEVAVLTALADTMFAQGLKEFAFIVEFVERCI